LVKNPTELKATNSYRSNSKQQQKKEPEMKIIKFTKEKQKNSRKKGSITHSRGELFFLYPQPPPKKHASKKKQTNNQSIN